MATANTAECHGLPIDVLKKLLLIQVLHFQSLCFAGIRQSPIVGIAAVQMVVYAAFFHQLLMGALLLNTVMSEHQDHRGIFDGGQSMGNGKGGARCV